MKPSIVSIILSALMLSACGGSNSTDSPMTTWSFSGSNGPEFWHLVVDTNGEPYTTCKYGQNQSPIDIPASRLIPINFNNIDFQYQTTGVKSTNLGYRIYGFDIQTDGTSDKAIVVDGVSSQLEQIHLHTPSDHKIDGKLFDGAMHFAHKDAAGVYTFVAVLLEVGARNPNLATLIDHLPDSVLQEVVPEFNFDITTLLPAESQRANFRYSGSFTVPPCTENVKWIVMQTPIELSQEQLDVFKTLFDQNTRPTQDLNGRTIEFDAPSSTENNA